MAVGSSSGSSTFQIRCLLFPLLLNSSGLHHRPGQKPHHLGWWFCFSCLLQQPQGSLLLSSSALSFRISVHSPHIHLGEDTQGWGCLEGRQGVQKEADGGAVSGLGWLTASSACCLSQSGEAGASQLLFANFNQDVTSLAVGSKSGYKFFSLSSVDKLEQIYECTDTEDVCVVERLFSSSLVAIVSLKAPRKLKVCHFKKGTEICNYSYSNTILAVKLNRQRLIVCLEESLYIHNIRDMKVLHTIRETPPNPTGLCALSINNDNCYLAYPGSATIGEVQVFDTINLRAANMIPAHDSPLAALAFDASGTKLATASEKGTVIRVFSIPEGQKLFEFRRGVKRCVSICSLAFSMDGMFLSASSNTETVHIFKLETVKEKPQEEPTTWTGYFGKVLMASTSYLPSQVTEMFNQGRAFATVRLPFCGHKNICALATIQKIPRLLVGASDGYLYMYNLDPQEGGECTLMKQHQLDGSMETTNEILDSTSHDCPLVTQAYGAAVPKGPHVPSSPTALAYTDELGAAGGSGLEDEASALRLEDDSEHPPMILRTD